jgi:ribose 5-phosphate isomerase A
MSKSPAEADVLAAADRAVEFVTDGGRVGLGTGRAASAFIGALGERVRHGLSVFVVPTSQPSARQAMALGIPIIELGEDVELDLTVDGADEVAPNLDLLKGRGGALVRERVVAAASRRQVILVSADKLVARLGTRYPVPVEIIPMARGHVVRELKALGLLPTLRLDGGLPQLTENHNFTIDVTLPRGHSNAPCAVSLASWIRGCSLVRPPLFWWATGMVGSTR